MFDNHVTLEEGLSALETAHGCVSILKKMANEIEEKGFSELPIEIQLDAIKGATSTIDLVLAFMQKNLIDSNSVTIH